jgi:hypothetical protein
MRESKASQGLTAGTIIIKRTPAAALRVELVSECVYINLSAKEHARECAFQMTLRFL